MLYKGVTGKIKIGQKDIAHIANFNVDKEVEIDSVPSFGMQYKEKVPGIADWTASADGAADFEDSSGQKEINDAFEKKELITVGFYLDDTTYQEGQAYIKKLSISHDAEGHAEISIDLEGTGSLKEPGMSTTANDAKSNTTQTNKEENK